MSAIPTRLPRVLGPTAATAIVVGTVIGSGVFKKPAAIAAAVPHSGLVALLWVAGGLLVLLGALAYAEVCVLFPRAGGNYVFLREAYGRLAGFLWGWVEFWIIRSASLAALATVFAESMADVLDNDALRDALGLPPWLRLAFWPQRLLTVAVLLALAAVNARGARWGSGLQVLVTSVKVGSLAAIAALPFVVLAVGTDREPPSTANLSPVWPASWSEVSPAGLGTALLGILWAYHGWMNLAPVAEEVKDPQRNLPLALLVGVTAIVCLYLGANLAYYLTLPGSVMAALTDRPVATAYALKLLGSLGGAAVSAAIMTSVFGALNGNLLVGPRLLYAMAEDGLAPNWLASVHPRYRTPAASIAVLAAWSVLLVLAVAALTTVPLRPGAGREGTGWGPVLDPSKSHFDRLTDFAMFGAVLFETMAVASIFVLRSKLPDAERPYRCPGYPAVPLLYVVLPAFVLVNMFAKQPAEAAAGVGFIGLGAATYFALGLSAPRALGHPRSETP